MRGIYSITHSISVSCEDGAIQLIEWSEGEGAVEVCQNGRFHRIESPGWDQREATVVCRKLHPSRGQQEWGEWGGGRGGEGVCVCMCVCVCVCVCVCDGVSECGVRLVWCEWGWY